MNKKNSNSKSLIIKENNINTEIKNYLKNKKDPDEIVAQYIKDLKQFENGKKDKEPQLPDVEKEKIKAELLDKKLKNFWKKNDKILADKKNENENEDKNKKNLKEEDKKKKTKKTLVLSEEILSKIQKEKQLKNKLKYGEKIRNINLLTTPDENKSANNKKDKNNNNNFNKKSAANIETKEKINNIQLPKINLFNQKEKKALMRILPEKELLKFEKRFESVEKGKNNLIRQMAVEKRQLTQEKEIAQKKGTFCEKSLEEKKKENKNLETKIKVQEKELNELKNKLDKLKKDLEKKKKQVKKKDEQNKKLLINLQKVQNGIDIDIEELEEEEVEEINNQKEVKGKKDEQKGRKKSKEKEKKEQKQDLKKSKDSSNVENDGENDKFVPLYKFCG